MAPFKYHWFPVVALDVKIAPFGEITGVVGVAFTTIVIPGEVAGLPVTVTPVKFDVKTHVTTCPVVKVVVV